VSPNLEKKKGEIPIGHILPRYEMRSNWQERITGSMIQSFYICKRQTWLISRNLNFEPVSLLELGRQVSVESYARKKKEIEIGNVKIDLLESEDSRVVVSEVKKSSRSKHAARIQLAFYLYKLKRMGISACGELLIPHEKRRQPVFLDHGLERELLSTAMETLAIISTDKPPIPIRIRYCRSCSFQEFCWA
jgi:CRISPR-associated exonuclease Cas4